VKPNINPVEVHPQLLSHNGHPVDGALVGAASLRPGEVIRRSVSKDAKYLPSSFFNF